MSEIPLRRLLGKFREVCGIGLRELKPDTSISRTQRLKANLMKVGEVLGRWLQRILDAGVCLPELTYLGQVFDNVNWLGIKNSGQRICGTGQVSVEHHANISGMLVANGKLP